MEDDLPSKYEVIVIGTGNIFLTYIIIYRILGLAYASKSFVDINIYFLLNNFVFPLYVGRWVTEGQ